MRSGKDVQIEMLENLLDKIEDRRRVKGSVTKSLNTPAKEAKAYYKGINTGVYMSTQVIHEMIRKLKNDVVEEKEITLL